MNHQHRDDHFFSIISFSAPAAGKVCSTVIASACYAALILEASEQKSQDALQTWTLLNTIILPLWPAIAPVNTRLRVDFFLLTTRDGHHKGLATVFPKKTSFLSARWDARRGSRLGSVAAPWPGGRTARHDGEMDERVQRCRGADTQTRVMGLGTQSHPCVGRHGGGAGGGGECTARPRRTAGRVKAQHREEHWRQTAGRNTDE